MAAQVSLPTTCINLQPGGTCCLREEPCPFGANLSGCEDARLGVRVGLAPDEFLVVTDLAGRPKAGRFPVRRCRVTSVEEGAGVVTSALLASRGDAAMLDAVELGGGGSGGGGGGVVLTSRDGQYSVVWREGRWLPG